MQRLYSLDEIPKMASEILSVDPENKIYLLEGDLGSGKTTMVKELCRQMGVVEEVSSPTFSIINEYTGKGGESIFHLDCYRLKSLDEARDIGAEDYFYSGNTCFIEWPEIILPLLPESFIKLEFNLAGSSKRSLTLNKFTDVRK